MFEYNVSNTGDSGGAYILLRERDGLVVYIAGSGRMYVGLIDVETMTLGHGVRITGPQPNFLF